MARRRTYPIPAADIAPTADPGTVRDRPGSILRTAGFAVGAALLIAGTYAGLEACSREPEAGASAFCAQISVVRGFDRALAAQDVPGMRRFEPELQKLQHVSPPEIRPRVEVLVAFTGDVTAAIESTRQLPVDDQARALDELWRSRQGELAGVQAAGRAVEAYTSATCGIDLTGTTTRDTAPGTGIRVATTR